MVVIESHTIFEKDTIWELEPRDVTRSLTSNGETPLDVTFLHTSDRASSLNSGAQHTVQLCYVGFHPEQPPDALDICPVTSSGWRGNALSSISR